jgi:hypothetical protein
VGAGASAVPRLDGNLVLHPVQVSSVLYLCGYARTKEYEATPRTLRNDSLLDEALSDFKRCLHVNPRHRGALEAKQKIEDSRKYWKADTIEQRIGPALVAGLALVVFAITQASFYDRHLAPIHHLTSATYVTLTFSSLLFVIAGVALPQLSKLSVAGMSLEKASATQATAPTSFGIAAPDITGTPMTATS